MAEDTENDSKTEEPTAHKLQQARSQGDVPKTPDLPSMMSFAAGASILAAMGGHMSRDLASKLLPFIADPGTIDVSAHGSMTIFKQGLMAAAPIMVIVLVAGALAGSIGHVVQTGLMFTPSKLKMDFKKLSPLGGLKRIFGLDGLLNFAKSLIKIFITGALAYWIVKPHVMSLLHLTTMEPAMMLPITCDILRRLVFAVMGLLLVIAGGDWFLQKQRFMQRMRMTKEEIKEDFKQQEGDPHVKARQKQLRATRARQRMMQAVPNATVVVMNPTHYAVALKYVAGEDEAPLCVAKGLDSLALKIRGIAEENDVPVIEDPPLARALYAAVDVDDMIPAAHYEAVAKIIGFILNGSKKPKARAL